jgi:hypothetical protein
LKSMVAMRPPSTVAAIDRYDPQSVCVHEK